MAEFISSFITGFQKVVQRDLESRLKGVKILNIFDGLIYYSYSGNSRDLEKITYFNNTFFIIKTFSGKNLNFENMVSSVFNEKKYYLINKGTFRVRFVKENQFAKVEKNLCRKAENIVIQNSKLKIDRVSPSTEIWYSIRRENFAFCGQLISKREFTEKNLNKGELRPEIAYLICRFAEIKNDDVIVEPFCGYASIPIQIAKKFNFSKLYVSDIDSEKIKAILAKKQFDNDKIEISVQDAFYLKNIGDKSVDLIITDPPWGFYESIENIEEFYEKMFKSFLRILKETGTIVILSARKAELEDAAKNVNLKVVDKIDTLVNGKKASVYKIVTENLKKDENV